MMLSIRPEFRPSASEKELKLTIALCNGDALSLSTALSWFTARWADWPKLSLALGSAT